MSAVDTNVIGRILTGDNAQQAEIAAARVSRGVFVSSGVLNETEWVLRSVFAWPRERIAAGLRRLLRERSLITDHGSELSWAADRRLGSDAGADVPVPVRLLA